MTSSSNKEKKLKYLGIQFISIDDPVLEQSRLSLGAQRSSSSIPKFNAQNSKSKIETLQHYPGLEQSNELFTRDEISEINYSVSLGSDTNNMVRFKPTSKLSLLKQTSQIIHEKNDYNKSLDHNELNDINFIEKNDKNSKIAYQLNMPSEPLTRCDSLISGRDIDTNFLQENDPKSISIIEDQINSLINADDSKEKGNQTLSRDEIQNQIWILAHDTATSKPINNLKENGSENLTVRSLPPNLKPRSKSCLVENKNTPIDGTIQNDETNKSIDEDMSKGNLNTKNINGNDDIDNYKLNSNNIKTSNSKNIINVNDNRILHKNSYLQIKKTNQLYNYAYQNGGRVQQINGSITNGKTNIALNKGEKRLKNIIALSSPKETISPEFNTPSILNKSYCARRISKYLQSNSYPLPTFLQEEDGEKIV